MTAPQGRVKPKWWNWHPNLVNLQFRALAHKMSFGLLLLEDGDRVWDLVCGTWYPFPGAGSDPTWLTDSPGGGGLLFDEANDFVEIVENDAGAAAVSPGTGDFTAFSFARALTTATDNCIAGDRILGSTGPGVSGWMLGSSTNGNTNRISVIITSGVVSRTIDKEWDGLLVNTDVAWCFTWSNKLATVKLYRNGVDRGVPDEDFQTLLAGDDVEHLDPLRLGNRAGTTARAWTGNIHCLWLFKHELTPAEVALLSSDPYGITRPAVPTAKFVAVIPPTRWLRRPTR